MLLLLASVVMLDIRPVAALASAASSVPEPAGAAADSARVDAAAGGAQDEKLSASAVRIAGERPVLDGLLDDAAWRKAPPVTRFLQKEPAEGGRPKENTEVRFCFDSRALYIGARMSMRRGGSVQSTLSRRDNAGNSERILFSLDTYHDRRTAYTFGITASGVRIDYYHPQDQEFARDYSFDPVWESSVTLDDSGWTAELRIPFSQLRFSGSIEQLWGLNINRYVPTENEDLYWALIPKHTTGWASRFGTLAGIRAIRSSYRIEIVPYVSGSSTIHDERDPADPYDDGTNLSGRAGLDFKMGLGPSLTLDATINPDFGQVEADPAEVNLSAYETFFSERRPFFIEGNQLLQGPGMSYFYSRRIGSAPHGTAWGDYVDAPGHSPILGAAKVTGSLPSGFSLGALGALTARVDARVYDTLTAQSTGVRVEPLTGFGVLRAQQQFGEAASTVGLMFTGVQRDLSVSEPLAAILNRTAVAGGGDFNLRFSEGAYELSGYAGFSHVTGAPASILRVQTSSAHYFQRPDASHVSIDTARTSLSGYCAQLHFAKNSGEHWLWGAQAQIESPGFELNDAGLLQSADNKSGWANLQYRDVEPRTILRSFSFDVAAGAGWNFGGIRQHSSVELLSSAMLWNYWNATARIEHGFRAFNDDLTRGGPLMGTAAITSLNLALGGNYALPTRWSAYTGLIRDDQQGWALSFGGSLSYRPSGRWELSLEPRWNRSVNPRQYFATVPEGSAATYGMRYIFSRIDRSTYALTLRLNYALSTDFTLELYTEPFAASGRYFGFGELPSPRSRDLRVYGTDGTEIATQPNGSRTITDGSSVFTLFDRDFNYLSFRSNLVLRWEWLRGSTLFLVWQQDRSRSTLSHDPIGPVDMFESIATSGTNFIALKISYWLPVN